MGVTSCQRPVFYETQHLSETPTVKLSVTKHLMEHQFFAKHIPCYGETPLFCKMDLETLPFTTHGKIVSSETLVFSGHKSV